MGQEKEEGWGRRGIKWEGKEEKEGDGEKGLAQTISYLCSFSGWKISPKRCLHVGHIF